MPFIKFDNGAITYEPLRIADYLEEKHLEKPLFLNGRYFVTFSEDHLTTFMPLVKAVVMYVYNLLENKEEKEYFRATKEGDKPYYSDCIMFAQFKPAQIISISTFDDIVTNRQDPVLRACLIPFKIFTI